MTVKDDLLKLKTVTATPVTTTEAGVTSLTRDGTTGQACVQIDKCPVEGIPIEVIAAADTGDGTTGTQTVTIEAAATVDGTYITVGTFPTLIQTAAANKTAKRMVIHVATQRKFLRSVITRVAGNGTMSRFYEINVGVGLIDLEP